MSQTVANAGSKAPTSKGGRAQHADRAALARYLVERYAAGVSLMRLSEDTGRSFGHVRRLLLDAGVTLRPRGGSRPRRT
ncbi:helix-turn-helix domain-containing protein [Actinomycetospora straminea]|uniref:helix-turn-helix domain-containing protein n=1 Tax=Actinomycetospora straminea TaxID=663607 RepID=UPI002366EBD1|nr:helix-turn-helix domain-containing protein [Actinomycetospora straminea]MDD7935774.1 helix-turn-helix domain-containing protein [Actinomycetospora straminea]